MPTYCCNKKKKYCNCEPVMDDCLAKKIECLWKDAFPNAMILPVIGYPSCGTGVMTLTHGQCMPPLVVNQLPLLSPLANNALYSAEVSCGKWVNLYEVMIPDIPGDNGCKSSSELYIKLLVDAGISVEGDHYH